MFRVGPMTMYMVATSAAPLGSDAWRLIRAFVPVQDNAECDDADKPHNWVSGVEHSQNCNRLIANSCTFNPDDKRGAGRTVELQPVKVTPASASTATARNRRRCKITPTGGSERWGCLNLEL